MQRANGAGSILRQASLTECGSTGRMQGETISRHAFEEREADVEAFIMPCLERTSKPRRCCSNAGRSLRAVVEHVALMASTACAVVFGARHEQFEVSFGFDVPGEQS